VAHATRQPLRVIAMQRKHLGDFRSCRERQCTIFCDILRCRSALGAPCCSTIDWSRRHQPSLPLCAVRICQFTSDRPRCAIRDLIAFYARRLAGGPSLHDPIPREAKSSANAQCAAGRSRDPARRTSTGTRRKKIGATSAGLTRPLRSARPAWEPTAGLSSKGPLPAIRRAGPCCAGRV
jgi:hypothetical protein